MEGHEVGIGEVAAAVDPAQLVLVRDRVAKHIRAIRASQHNLLPSFPCPRSEIAKDHQCVTELNLPI